MTENSITRNNFVGLSLKILYWRNCQALFKISVCKLVRNSNSHRLSESTVNWLLVRRESVLNPRFLGITKTEDPIPGLTRLNMRWCTENYRRLTCSVAATPSSDSKEEAPVVMSRGWKWRDFRVFKHCAAPQSQSMWVKWYVYRSLPRSVVDESEKVPLPWKYLKGGIIEAHPSS